MKKDSVQTFTEVRPIIKSEKDVMMEVLVTEIFPVIIILLLIILYRIRYTPKPQTNP